MLALAGCMTRPPAPPVPSACDVSRGTLGMLGSSRDAVRAVLGPPSRLAVQEQPNRHVPGAIDRLHVMSWDGLEITIHEAPTVDREFLSGVIATGQGRVPVSSWIGRTREALEEALGEPVRSTGDIAAEWECYNELAPETMEVRFVDSVAVEVRLRYPID